MNKNILFTVWYAEGFHGAVMHIHEISEYLINKGYNVYCTCKVLSEDVKNFYENSNIKIFTLDKVNYDITYDIIWNLHFPFLSFLLKNNIKYKNIIYNCLSSFLKIESPPIFYNELSMIIANSDETKDRLANSYFIEKDKIYVLRNLVPTKYFIRNKNNNNALTQVAIVSSHIPQEILDSVSILEKKGIKCTKFGYGNVYQPITPELLSKFDVIITIGKTVQYALAMGIPCYNYDRFGGSGYINLNNIYIEEYYNFSGRSSRTIKNSYEIVDEIINQYEDILKQTSSLRKIAQERYLLPLQIDKILEKVENKKIKIQTEKYNLSMDHDFCLMELTPTVFQCNNDKEKYINKNLMQNIFSIKNEYSNNKKHKVITILGLKIKLKTAETLVNVERDRE